MKRLILALLSVLAIATPAFAIVGGPWDGNVPGNPNKVNPANINGTYQGTIRGTNLVGITRFGTSAAGTPAASGTAATTGTASSATIGGYAVAFVEGTIALAQIDVTTDLGARQISGIIEGGSTQGYVMTLSRPATTTTAIAYWDITQSAYFTGFFTANLSSSWSNNSYKGNGWLLMKKVDITGFIKDLSTYPTTAEPKIVTVPVPIKLSGVKTTDTSYSYSGTFPARIEPVVGTAY